MGNILSCSRHTKAESHRIAEIENKKGGKLQSPRNEMEIQSQSGRLQMLVGINEANIT